MHCRCAMWLVRLPMQKCARGVVWLMCGLCNHTMKTAMLLPLL